MCRWSMILLVFVGCHSSQTTVCGSNICSTKQVCAPQLEQCVTPERIEACVDRLEGDRCDAAGAVGVCTGGVCTSGCGDGVVEAERGEECDGPISATSCESYDFYTGSLTCTASCTVDTGGCNGFCGDSEVNGLERCDESGLSSCLGIGFHRGLFGCPDCQFDFSGCSLNEVARTPELDESWMNDVATTERGLIAVGRFGATQHLEYGERIYRTSGVQNDLNTVWAFSANDAYAAGNFGELIKYDGTSWSEVDVGSISESVQGLRRFSDLWGVDGHVVAVGITLDESTFVVVKYDGETWTYEERFGIREIPVMGVTGTAVDDFYVAAGRTIEHYDGVTWSAVPGPNYGELGGIYGDHIRVAMTGEGDLWLAGYGSLFERRDGTWTLHSQALWRDVLPLSRNNVYVKGVSGIWRYDGEGFQEITVDADPSFGSIGDGLAAKNRTLYAASKVGVLRFDGSYLDSDTAALDFDGDNVQSLAIASDGTTYALAGGVLHVYESGFVPVADLPAATAQRRDMLVNSLDEVFLVDNLALHRYHDSTWSTYLTNSFGLGLIWRSHAVGDEVYLNMVNGFLKYKNDGLSEVPRVRADGSSNMLDVQLSGLFMESATRGYAVGQVDMETGIVFEYDGSIWREIHTTAERLLSVVVLGDGRVLVADENGSVLTYDGTTWSSEEVHGDYVGLFVLSPREVVAIDSGSAAYLFDGTQWSLLDLTIGNDYPPWGVSARGQDLWLRYADQVRRVIRLRPWLCEAAESQCTDGMDNDCDGAFDEADSDCP